MANTWSPDPVPEIGMPTFVDDDDEDSSNTKRAKGRRVKKEFVEENRQKLFDEGSDFKPTERSDIVGIDNVLVEIEQIIHWLQHSADYQHYGSRLEPGILFEGDPGTGKTLVSRYIASASNALFINVRDWPHENSLFTDSDIARLFGLARETYAKNHRPIVLFWDEFENGAVERSNASPEQVQVVSQLTAELDGVHGKNEGVVLIGCTNYAYGIDRALRRAGRMGVHIEFTPPDRKGKKLLLEHYLGKYNIEEGIDLDTLSYFFESGANAAEIEEACVEAWRYAVRRALEDKADPRLAQQDLIKVFLKRLVGPPTMFMNLPEEDRLRVAIHECGHAIMALVFGIPLRLITVQPGKKSLGRVIYAEIREHIGTHDEVVCQMRVTVGSIIAERVAEIAAMTGSTADIMKLNQLAAQLVDSLSFGKETDLFNPASVGGYRAGRHGEGASPNISNAFIEASDWDVQELLSRVQNDAAVALDRLGKAKLHELAHIVNERVTLTGDQFAELFREVTGYEPTSLRPDAKLLTIN